jgi:hypothetical protein
VEAIVLLRRQSRQLSAIGVGCEMVTVFRLIFVVWWLGCLGEAYWLGGLGAGALNHRRPHRSPTPVCSRRRCAIMGRRG